MRHALLIRRLLSRSFHIGANPLLWGVANFAGGARCTRQQICAGNTEGKYADSSHLDGNESTEAALHQTLRFLVRLSAFSPPNNTTGNSLPNY